MGSFNLVIATNGGRGGEVNCPLTKPSASAIFLLGEVF